MSPSLSEFLAYAFIALMILSFIGWAVSLFLNLVTVHVITGLLLTAGAVFIAYLHWDNKDTLTAMIWLVAALVVTGFTTGTVTKAVRG